GAPVPGPAVVLSGSCSTMTNAQVARYRPQAPYFALEVARCLEDGDGYAAEVCQWVLAQGASPLAPMVFATSEAETLQRIQQQHGAEKSSQAIERFFARLVPLLADKGIQRFIVAGGETSGVVTQALRIQGLHIGPMISPGI
ncbi:four-carbon acid sugar kinase family protein, partial [Raoultella sp. 18079]